MSIIYGVDTEKPFTAIDVRDAIVECFVEAHKEQLDELASYSTEKLSQEELHDMKIINVRQLVRNAFKDSGGDFEAPDKASIQKAIGGLKAFASNFRNQAIVEKHYAEISELINEMGA